MKNLALLPLKQITAEITDGNVHVSEIEGNVRYYGLQWAYFSSKTVWHGTDNIPTL